MLSDLSRRLWIDFPARQRGELVANIHHGVTAFTLAVINPKTETHRTSLAPDLPNEAVSFVHRRAEFVETTSDNFVRMSTHSDKKVRLWRSALPPLTQPSRIGYFRNTEFRILSWTAGMIPLDPLPNLIDQVYARILEAIIDRMLPPGQRIRQNELAEKLGVSRQPVSHALHLLHRQGLVAESGRRGFEVTGLDPQRIRQLYEVRGAIDALAARLAAGRIKTDVSSRARLEAALQAGRAIDKTTPLARLIALDVAFHSAIYRLSGNPAIEELIAPQWPHMRRSMATVLAELDYRESAWTEHEAIAAQIFAGNAKAAEAAALAHAQTAGRLTEERLKATDSTSPGISGFTVSAPRA